MHRQVIQCHARQKSTPGKHIGQLLPLTEAERQRLLVEWNATETEYPKDKCIHTLFEEQVARTPDAVAVVFEGEELTYAELNRRANRLAHHLRDLGVSQETLVAVCVERSLEMVVGLLGILKAGGAYVPLDPDYPARRLAFVLEDTRAPVLLTQSHLRDKLPCYSGHIVDLNCLEEVCTDHGDENPDPNATPQNLAYVIYTSGSTGTPKGVMIQHDNVCRLFSATWEWFRFDEHDVWTLFHSYAFDFSVWEIWGALLYGGRLVIVPRRVTRSPHDFYDLLCQTRVTVLNQTPPAFSYLQEVDRERFGSGDALSLRLIIFGGESLNVGRLRGWIDRHGDQKPELVNMYGITETTVHVTYRRITREDLECGSGSPIGVPIPDLKVCLLDEHQKPLPAGVPGEIYVNGPGVARGYLNRPELTESRFVQDPFTEGRGGRLYRSGDLACRLPTGELEYRGRADDQVKIRGFRVELGEIETVLNECPSVGDAVVVVREDRFEDKRLAAYIVREKTGTPTIDELRAALSARLPHYMIPGAFVFVDRFPLTPNGKIDRHGLPAPEAARPDLESGYVAPRTELEHDLAEIWCDVLGLEKIGIHDNFFELGGHSLHAMKVVSHMRSFHQGRLSPAQLFRTRTISELAEFLDNEEGASAGVSSVIGPVCREGPSELSFAQQRLWLLDHFGMGGHTMNIPRVHRIRGPLREEVLAQCLQKMVDRHEALRTTFAESPEGPQQNISARMDVRLERNDLSDLPVRQREEEARSLAETEARRPFDLSEGPLFRATLIRLNEEDHVFVFVVHHIVFDGWSEALLYRELRELYASLSRGEPSPLEELPIQYADFASWQREDAQLKAFEAELDYWRSQLEGSPRVLELPTDHAHPAQPTFFGRTVSRVFPESLLHALKRLCDGEDATLFMILLAAFEVLLHRYTGDEDVVVGSVVANRNRSEIEELIGFFVNTLALRTDLSGNPPFLELLRRVREVTLGAYSRQDVPFERIVEELHPERNLSHSPLFQVMFVHQNTPQEPLELPGLTVTPVEVDYGASKVDLTMFTYDQPDGLKVAVEYNTDLFEPETIERLFGHFQTLLEGIVANPETPIGELPLLTEAERHQLLVEWNATETDYPKDKCIHTLFEEQVERTPDEVAVVFEGEELTYDELNRRANRLARRLRGLGVERETLVAICVERSLEMVVGLLGILKAGGAYVPLDPDYPSRRLAFMLDDTRAPVLLTQSHLHDKLPDYTGHVLDLDRLEEVCSDRSDNPDSVATPENLAYVIYTSGSTGTPKGVNVPHRGVIRLVVRTNYVALGSDDRFIQFAPLAFDASTFEIWGPLLNGGRLFVLPPRLATIEELGRFIRENAITTLWLTAGLFHEWTDEQLDALSGLRRLLTGGDVVSPVQAARALRRLPNTRLINGYGPTENTTFTCCHCMDSPDQVGRTVSIGRPIAGTRVYVLDQYLQPVPIGVPGELCIGGDGLARDYLHGPELTAEKFITSPFDACPDSRLYRTGDRVRWRSDGTLEFLGRLDCQVKIRGFRVELSEVEAVLKQHPRIGDAVVCLREDRPGEKYLAAYVVGQEQSPPATRDLKAFVKETLPRHMIPSEFVEVDGLPLTRNGKVDRSSLPAPKTVRREMEDGYVAARNELEQSLVEIWCDVLGLEKVGIHDSFFELGGHSLLVVKVAARIQQSFCTSLSANRLYASDTISKQAHLLKHDTVVSHPTSLVTVQSQGKKPPLVFMPGASGRPFVSRAIIGQFPSDQPVYALRMSSGDQDDSQPTTMERMAGECVRALIASEVEGPFILAGYSFGGMLAYEVARKAQEAGIAVADVLIIDTGPIPKNRKGPFGFARKMRLVFGNLPLWLYYNVLTTSPRRLYVSLRRKLNRVVRNAKQQIAAGPAMTPRIRPEDVANVSGLTPEEYHISQDRLNAFFEYSPSPYSGRITVFRATARPLLHSLEPDLGWSDVVGDKVTVERIPGEHELILRPPYSRVLVARLTEILDRVAVEHAENNRVERSENSVG